MTGDSQARICEGLGVQFPGPTRPGLNKNPCIAFPDAAFRAQFPCDPTGLRHAIADSSVRTNLFPQALSGIFFQFTAA